MYLAILIALSRVVPVIIRLLDGGDNEWQAFTTALATNLIVIVLLVWARPRAVVS